MKCKIKKCDSTEFKYAERIFKNGTKHYERICKKCNKHNHYASPSEALSGEASEQVRPTQESRKKVEELWKNIFELGGQEMYDDYIEEMIAMYKKQTDGKERMQQLQQYI